MKPIEVRQKKDTRSGFGDALADLGKKNEKVVALCADLTGSLKMNTFAANFPERFFQTGIAEANMIGMASGLAIAGYIPYTGTFANFSTGRVYDQIRQCVAYSNKNVKICASHAGITLGEDGATHQIMEDIALMRALPNMTVINTCDYSQTYMATQAIAEWDGPVYLRFGRPVVPDFSPIDTPFQIGKGIVFTEGTDVTIVATGHLVWEALEASRILETKGISAEIINIHTIKPLDNELLLKSISKTRCVVSAEEHVQAGGLGEAISALLSQKLPTAQEYVAMPDVFGESGTPEELMVKYGLKAGNIVDAAIRAINRKTNL
ncbi:MAG: transketolase C-terminal domain-containing protein [Bacteroidales bacterium]|jgi:transketolase|nr:transketolase C-terminal domain-containing protein [Bacteroidales bacterium]